MLNKIDENGYFLGEESPYVETIPQIQIGEEVDEEGNVKPVMGDDPSFIKTSLPEGIYVNPGFSPQWNGKEWAQIGQPPKPQPQEKPLELKNRADIDYISLMIGVEL